MPCTSPVNGFRTESGTFTTRANDPTIVDSLIVPCGKCRFCVSDLSRQWMVRAVHESLSHVYSCFVTLTYDPEHLPALGSLSRRDVQLFSKRLRKWCNSVDIPSPVIFGCGEYGGRTMRPHYHLCIFGLWFPDAKPAARSELGMPYFTSEILSGLWGLGRCNFSSFSARTAGYVAHYSMGKFDAGQMEIYDPVPDPETGELLLREEPFLISPRRPALGRRFIEKHWESVYSDDFFVLPNGHKSGHVDYYDEWLREHHPARFEEIKAARLASALEGCDPEDEMRLLARSFILEQRLSRFKREAI